MKKKFRDFLREETTSADIATVDTVLNTTKRVKGKRCKKHKKINCEICDNEKF